MDVKILLPFVEAVANVLPQMGFQSVARSGLKVTKGMVGNNGVLVNIGLVGMLAGNVIYNITADSAKNIASKMMMGAPVSELDAMAQSAVCELGNMLAANAAIALEALGVQIDISPPGLIIGSSFTAPDPGAKGIVVEMKADDSTIEVTMLIIPKI
ncbi:MAG: chemotaxis protein CheX [Acidaminococcales bacterium]|nr:chemotaxis protein CheX [Acidaminococcales bacterium]